MNAMRGKLEEIRDVTQGLWVWRVHHPKWHAGADWDPVVASTCVRGGSEVALLDPLAPPGEAKTFWDRLDHDPPTCLVVLLPDHARCRSVRAALWRSGYGPYLFWRDDVPEVDLVPVDPGSRLPGGLLALYDGRGRKETPLWLPEQHTLVFGDGLTERDGKLRVWSTPWHEERVLPALRSTFELPFQHVIISHGQPLHDRAAFERALERWPVEAD
jgi:hypothetical protein